LLELLLFLMPMRLDLCLVFWLAFALF
jgi:hypothetical protein